MSVDFSKVTEWVDQYGALVQVADESGRVVWAVSNDEPFTFKAAKLTSNTYAGETSYTNEKFILIDVYPKTNGTVNVTYEGLTKTVADTSGAEEPNAVQVFFGTFNGVSDSVSTPDSGIVTITGDWRGAGCGVYKKDSKTDGYANCITAIGDLSGSEVVPTEAFYNCGNIKKAEIPDGVTKIGTYAFYNCSKLTEVKIPDSVTGIGVFDILENNSHVFYNCKALTSVNLPNGIEFIGPSNFSGCSSLKSITLPNSVTDICNEAFANCSSLTNVNIPSNVTIIGVNAFLNCKSLTSVTIPSNVYSALGNPWAGCFEKNAITVESGNQKYKIDGNCLVETIGNNTYSSYLVAGFSDSIIPSYIEKIYDYAFYGVTTLKSISIPNSVKAIGPRAFYGCTALESISIPNSVTTIETHAFYGCTNLANVTLPSAIATVDSYTFYNCKSLTSVTIPSAVTKINGYAFGYCSNLTNITLLPTTPPTISSYTFSYTTCTFTVPAGCGEAYRAASYWADLADRITEAS